MVSFQLQLKKIIQESDGKETTEEGVIQLQTVSFPSLPETGLDLKKGIERALNIPVCVQTLFFGPTIVKNKQPICKLRLRDQDSLTLEYSSHAEITIIDDIIQIMVETSNLMTRILESLHYDTPRLDATLDALVQEVIDPFTVEKLVFMFASSATSTVYEVQLAKANRLYFIHSGGVGMATFLHCQLVQAPWRQMSIEMQYMEHTLLRILWDLSSTLGARYLLLDETFSVIFNASNSLMRGHIVPHQRVYCPLDQFAAEQASAETQQYIIGETMYKAMGVLANLTELPECRAKVISYPRVLNQMMAAILSPTYTFVCAELVLSALLCLSYSTELHSKLAERYVIEGILKACKRFEEQLEEVQRADNADQNSIDPKDITLIKYFSMMFFALLMTGSPTLLAETNPDLLPQVDEFITNFIDSTTCDEVHIAEIKTNYFWSTLKPIVKITYFHFETHANHYLVQNYPILRNLYKNSMIAGVFSLGNMILKDNFRTILDQEELTDFVVCLPWILPQEVLEEVRELAYSLQKVTRTAPKLTNLMKARLATSYFSFDTTTNAEFLVCFLREVTITQTEISNYGLDISHLVNWLYRK